MASGTKTDNVFTRSGMGNGKSEGEVMTTAAPGRGSQILDTGSQQDLAAYPQDNVHGVDLPNVKGGPMGGGVTNLAHSLRGTSAVQK